MAEGPLVTSRLKHSLMQFSPEGLRHSRHRRIGIIGAGPGGLAAAMLLARTGIDVTVFERHPRVGGRSATIVAPGPGGQFRFDMGPTFFLYPQALAEIFAACGRDLNREVELVRIDPQYDLVFESGGRLSASGDLAKLAEEVAKFSPEDARNLPRFMAENRGKLDAFRPVLQQPFNSFADWLSPQMLRALPLMRPLSTVDRDLSRYFRDPRVRLAFSFQTKYLGMSPFRCPSLFTILAFMEYEYGVWHPIGGCGAVMAAMARVAGELGADIRLAEPVERILFEGKRAVGVVTEAGEERFDALVVNADFAHAMTHLVPDALRRRWSDRKLKRKKFSCSTFMLYLGLKGRYDDLAHHTIFLTSDYRRNVAEIENGALISQPSLYMQNASVTDDTLAPPGHSTLYVLLPVANLVSKKVDWPEVKMQFRRTAFQRLAALGLTDVERRIVFEKIVTPTDWRDGMSVYQGATFNLSHNIGQMLHMRPRNRFEDLDGVYLVGGGTHPGSGLPVIFESARITTKLIAEDLDMSPDWDTRAPLAAPICAPQEEEVS
jgi:phytoene desaturase